MLKNGTEILVGQEVFKFIAKNNKSIVLINKSQTA